jgi:hypothetical protein
VSLHSFTHNDFDDVALVLSCAIAANHLFRAIASSKSFKFPLFLCKGRGPKDSLESLSSKTTFAAPNFFHLPTMVQRMFTAQVEPLFRRLMQVYRYRKVFVRVHLVSFFGELISKSIDRVKE